MGSSGFEPSHLRLQHRRKADAVFSVNCNIISVGEIKKALLTLQAELQPAPWSAPARQD